VDGLSAFGLVAVSAMLVCYAFEDRSAQRGQLRRTGFVVALAGSVILAVASIPALAFQFHRIVSERMEPYDLVTAAGLSNAVVIIGSSTGSAYPVWMESQDLTRNGIAFSGSVLYANDVPGGSCALARVFPGRAFYRYAADSGRYPGRLHPISPCS